jgi:Carbohydrate-binding domain-containing protein Cthe_2159
MKNIKKLYIVLNFALALSACTGSTIQTDERYSSIQVISNTADEAVIVNSSTEAADNTTEVVFASFDESDLEASENSADMSLISLNGDSITVEGDGAIVNGSTVTIFQAGTYSISGVLNDGQLLVDTPDEEIVTLVLNGASITSSTSAPVYILNAEKTVITLAEGSENFMTDSDSYLFVDPESSEPNAAIFSNDNLTINGSGYLVVNANYKNGIVSNDDLKITAGSITVNAVNDGIKGKDSLAILDGSITINAGGDGLQAYNDEDLEKGYVAIEGGVFYITAGLDGIQAETQLAINNGDFTIKTNQSDSVESGKGLKAGTALTITGGIFKIDAADDAIHANEYIIIDSGEFALASGDDGIHADTSVTINGGNINILKAYEGIESTHITINDGNIHLVSSDDGLNASNGQGGGMDDESFLSVNGGLIVLNTEGDGFDSNGSSLITGGTVIVNGPTTNRNGPLDVNGSLEITGGTLIAVGSAGMPELPADSSTQNSIAMVLDSTQAGGTMLHIESENGEEILSFVPVKTYQYIAVSSPDLQSNETYNIYIGGSSTGNAVDGLYQNSDYSAGTLVSTEIISSTVTTIGNISSNMGGGRPSKGDRP